MEYGPENDIFVLKLMMKSGLEKIIFNSSMSKLFSNKWICYIEKHRVTNSVQHSPSVTLPPVTLFSPPKYTRVANVVAHHDELLTQGRYI